MESGSAIFKLFFFLETINDFLYSMHFQVDPWNFYHWCKSSKGCISHNILNCFNFTSFLNVLNVIISSLQSPFERIKKLSFNSHMFCIILISNFDFNLTSTMNFYNKYFYTCVYIHILKPNVLWIFVFKLFIICIYFFF